MEAFSSGLFKSVGNKVRQFAFNLTETELKVEEATNSDKWGPHGSLMAELAQMCYDHSKYKEIMQVLARRLTDTGEEWRHVYKALLVMEYLVKHGPMKVVHELQGNLSFLEELQSFKYKDKAGKDHGLNVRNRARTLETLVSNQERVLQERENAQRNKSKYSGSSRDEMVFSSRSPRMGGDSAGFGSNSGGFGGTYEGFGGQARSASPVTGRYGLHESPTALSDDDPFEATRKRIEKLKGENQVDEKLPPPRAVGLGLDTGGGAGLNSPKGPRKEPKTLSQVKVNPEIAAAFSKMHVTPVAPQGPRISLGGIVGNGMQPTVASGENDLLGGLDDPPSNNAATGDLLGAGLDTLEISPTPPTNGANSQANEGWSAFESGPTQEHPVDPFSQMSAGTNLGQTPAPSSDPFVALSGGTQQPVSPVGAVTNTATAPLPDFFMETPNPPAQPAMHPMGGVGGGPIPQGANFATHQNPPNPMGGINVNMAMNMNAGTNPGGGGFGGHMGNWQNSNPGFAQAPVPQMSPQEGGTNLGGFMGMMGQPSGTGGGGGGFGNFASAPPSALPMSGGQMQSKTSRTSLEMGAPGKGSSAPMRPGASRPVATRKKDPFADLGVL
ncbi:hypothetical protein BSKO_01218 [Bryopsis sp. KO-2023]|nr:hypothetical protein BSKO_01218 [Bryopsis sp. KO-2023]